MISVGKYIVSSQKAENVINGDIGEEWAKYWILWHPTINILQRTDFII